MIGTTLSHFRITAKLGEGGMGEVYHAEDTKLGRKVAIKVLPDTVASDPERLARFEREAKLLAALNHPSIASIYSFESAEVRAGTGPASSRGDGGETDALGDSSAARRGAPVHFLVMELAEGEDLRERLARGPIPVDETLSIALQIARALEAAHERGIIHRDLKPANLKVDDEGEVKVLDFGLAKALDTTAGDSTAGGALDHSPLSLSPTLTARMTGAGVLLGTAAYMSPEQARGKTADKRADIWAFGVVVWEMLTGRRLFDGETVSDTLAAVLRADPEWETLGADTPRSLQRVLRRCLVKNPRDRLHDIADARIEIEEAISGSREVLPSVPELTSSVAGWRRGSLALGAAAGLVLGAAATALLAPMLGGRPAREPHQAIRVASATPAGVPVKGDDKPILAISPDGQRLVVSGGEEDSRQLYQRHLRQFEWLPIPGTEKGYLPFFSPDGQWLGFFAEGKLKKVAVSGGAPQVLCDASNSFGATWGPGGFIVFNPTSPAGLLRVSELGGTPEELIDADSGAGESELNWPQFLPDGQSLVFTIWRGDSVEGSQVALLDLSSREKKILLDGGYGRITSSGHLLYTLADGVYVAPFDSQRREVTGPGVPLPEPIFRFAPYWLPALAVSTSGSLAYIPGRSEPQHRLVAVTPDGVEELLVEATGAYMYPRLSPDGTRLAVDILEAGGANIWIIDLTTGARSRLTRDGKNLYPLWTADGSRIIYYSDREGTGSILWRPGDGSGSPEELLVSSPPTYVGFPTSVSPDGRHLLFSRFDENDDRSFKSAALTALNLGDPSDELPLLTSQDEDLSYLSGTFSPDGAWIAYVSGDGQSPDEVFVQRFPEGGARHQVSQGGGRKPQWSPDGSEIYYRAPEDRFMAARLRTEPALAIEPPRLLFADVYDAGTYIPMPNYTIVPDGSRIIMVKPDSELGESAEIRLVIDWFAELQTLVPTAAP